MTGCNGGPCASDGGFTTPAERAALLAHHLALMRGSGMDGLSFDWEHIPSDEHRNETVISSMQVFLKELRAAAPEAHLSLYVQGSPDYGYLAWKASDVAHNP